LSGVEDLKANLNTYYGQPLIYRYLIASKEDYNKYFKGNKGFEFSLIEGRTFYLDRA
jgi:hypothetical protein